MREEWTRQLEDLRRNLKLTESFLREAEKENRPEQAARSREKLALLKTELRAHSIKLFSV